MENKRELEGFFSPQGIAVIGVSRNPDKVGHVVFKNLIDSGFHGEVFPVNPKAEQILHYKTYKSVRDIKKKVDLGVIAVPAKVVLQVVRECNYAGIKNVLILSSGFSEIGNKRDELELKNLLQKEGMNCIGVNCLGIFDSATGLDALFIPRYRLKRPKEGGIGFVCQSGAIGAAILDIATEKGHKFSKFISYGNATDIDESDLLEYLGQDEKTKVICLYLEGIKDGEKFFRIAQEVSKKKPIVAIKGGLTKEGSEAALSHTGALAGTKEVYFGVFKQTGIIRADNLEEMFDIASLVEKGLFFSGNRVQIITNGGGYGIVSTDLIAESDNLHLAQLSDNTSGHLRKEFPKTINIHNPLDLVGDATTERYKVALENCIRDKNVDAILLIVLYQTPLITGDIVQVISSMHQETKKPIVVVSTGGEFTEALTYSLQEHGLCVFPFPKNAVSAMDKLVWYDKKKKLLL
jgi:acetyl coenzyme A synthetase (ADP forming)-like protein